MKIFRKFLLNLRKNDPLYSCELFMDLGCSHVDGYLCDFPKCKMNKDYINKKQEPE